MNNRSSLSSLFTLILLLSGSAFSAEFYDKAEVIRTEPLTTIEHNRHLAYECFNKPDTNDLVALLHWDFGSGHCSVEETTETITGYRVYYRWDDQVFSHVMAEHPGGYIPVRVEIE